MDLISIAPPDYEVALDLAYATPRNVTGKPIYGRAACYLHRDAAALLARAIRLAAAIGLRFKIFDGYRPTEAQWVLWRQFPIPDFFADPRKGSPHSRGVAVDLTLIDAEGAELDMGTGFDDLTDRAHHGCLEVSPTAQRNRAILLGLMSAAGWDFYDKEWWHYQLFEPKRYLLLGDAETGLGIMPATESARSSRLV